MSTTPGQTGFATVQQAADLLQVDRELVLDWIEQERIPFIRIPEAGYQIPLRGLIAALPSLSDLVGNLEELAAALRREEGLQRTAEWSRWMDEHGVPFE